MRRIAALVGAVALALTFAGTSVGSGPINRVNTFVGSFDMLEGNTVIGHVTANFKLPDYGRLVPGSLDVVWTSDTTFPFPESLSYPPAKESHAQLLASFFGPDPDAGGLVAGVSGYLCDYSAPWNAECREFSAIFVNRDDGSRTVAWAFPSDYTLWYGVGRGSFAMTYAGTSG